MIRGPRLALAAAALALSACAATGTGGPAGAGASPGTPEALRTFWPEGVPTPPPPRTAPTIGESEKGADGPLQITYEPPHLVFRCLNTPGATYSVIYLVASKRHKQDRMQIDSVEALSAFTGKLEYDRLAPGEYTVMAYLKGVAEPVDSRTVTVPD